MFSYNKNAKIYPTVDEISKQICQKYCSSKFFTLSKIFTKKTKVNKYLDANFIACKTLPKEELELLLEKFINNERCEYFENFAYSDIAKYIRNHWSDPELEPYVKNITNHLEVVIQNKPETDEANKAPIIKMKHWYLEFLPLVTDGKKLILKLVCEKKLEGIVNELLYGIYLMEPEELNRFYPEFLILVNDSDSFNLWSRSGAFFYNYKIIEKLYLNGYNIFSENFLIGFWSEPFNAHYKEIIMEKLKKNF